MRKYYIDERTLAQNDPFPGCMGIYEDKDVDARIAELHKIVATLWNDVDPLDYPEISDAVHIELARVL